MTTTMRREREATILYRVALKQHPGIVVWQVLSSDGVTKYDVTMVRGKVNNCTCKATKPCYHMTAVQAREDERSSQMREFYCQTFEIYP